ncbi:MAG TPA: hypothetical protein VLM79_07660 [Kofleriaceae bacterium]|nr:hypothetical protein [Kofleriaceae bacterium]
MIWLAVALALIAVALFGVRHASRRTRSAATPIVPPELAHRLAAATHAFVDAAPWQPSSAPDAPAAAAAIEAALIARDPRRALETAETALASSPSPDRDGSRTWLAWALCASAQPRAALDQLAKAGAPGESRDALARYVAARAAHLLFEHGHGASGAVPPLITTGDLAVVTLGRGRGGATWLTGATDVQLSASQVSAAIAEHREVTAHCLAGALDALDLAPGFADTAYLAARLALKAGLVAEARALFDALAPRMLGRPDGDAFERDRADLTDPTRAVAAAREKPLDKGQRSRSLRVLP